MTGKMSFNNHIRIPVSTPLERPDGAYIVRLTEEEIGRDVLLIEIDIKANKAFLLIPESDNGIGGGKNDLAQA